MGTNEKGFDLHAGNIWIYPTNYPVRDYQYNIIRQCLWKNTLVVLPTGLGKTFIAAVVMFNYYRWYPNGKVVFMAPTKPLVAQQTEACYKIMGIPRQHTAEMTGAMAPGDREKAWQTQRVFFLTPQVLVNDLLRQAIPAQQIKCLVIDEAHKATGNHAYCQVVREILQTNKDFRILALSATPGSDIKAVQCVLENLLVSHVELRGEESIDLQAYTHQRIVDKVVVPLSQALTDIQALYLQVLTVKVNKLKNLGVLYARDPKSLSKFLILKAREAFRQNPPQNLQRSQFGAVEADFALCMSLYHGFELLQLHGLRSLHSFMESLLTGDKGYGKTKAELMKNQDFMVILEKLRDVFGNKPDSAESKPFVFGHPKLEKLLEIVLQHFSKFKEAGDSTRVMIFSQYRDSVAEITQALGSHAPLIRVMSFIGQSTTGTSSKGLSQKDQLKVMRQFRQGDYNTLVATCVGEEGLDIGDVDLIICYDAHKSPIRLVQRMGRTGRKRKGRIVMLVTKGKEEQIYNQSQYSRKKIFQAIMDGAKSLKFYPHNPAMIPEGIKPECHKMFITVDNSEVPPVVATNKTSKRTSTVTRRNIKTSSVGCAKKGYLTTAEQSIFEAKFSLNTEENDIPKTSDGAEFLTLTKPSTDEVEVDQLTTGWKWLPWQNRAHDTKLMTHSNGTRHLLELVEFLDVQSLVGDEDGYGVEMKRYLRMDDVIKQPPRKADISLCFKKQSTRVSSVDGLPPLESIDDCHLELPDIISDDKRISTERRISRESYRRLPGDNMNNTDITPSATPERNFPLSPVINLPSDNSYPSSPEILSLRPHMPSYQNAISQQDLIRSSVSITSVNIADQMCTDEDLISKSVPSQTSSQSEFNGPYEVPPAPSPDSIGQILDDHFAKERPPVDVFDLVDKWHDEFVKRKTGSVPVNYSNENARNDNPASVSYVSSEAVEPLKNSIGICSSNYVDLRKEKDKTVTVNDLNSRPAETHNIRADTVNVNTLVNDTINNMNSKLSPHITEKGLNLNASQNSLHCRSSPSKIKSKSSVGVEHDISKYCGNDTRDILACLDETFTPVADSTLNKSTFSKSSCPADILACLDDTFNPSGDTAIATTPVAKSDHVLDADVTKKYDKSVTGSSKKTANTTQLTLTQALICMDDTLTPKRHTSNTRISQKSHGVPSKNTNCNSLSTVLEKRFNNSQAEHLKHPESPVTTDTHGDIRDISVIESDIQARCDFSSDGEDLLLTAEEQDANDKGQDENAIFDLGIAFDDVDIIPPSPEHSKPTSSAGSLRGGLGKRFSQLETNSSPGSCVSELNSECITQQESDFQRKKSTLLPLPETKIGEDVERRMPINTSTPMARSQSSRLFMKHKTSGGLYPDKTETKSVSNCVPLQIYDDKTTETNKNMQINVVSSEGKPGNYSSKDTANIQEDIHIDEQVFSEMFGDEDSFMMSQQFSLEPVLPRKDEPSNCGDRTTPDNTSMQHSDKENNSIIKQHTTSKENRTLNTNNSIFASPNVLQNKPQISRALNSDNIFASPQSVTSKSKPLGIVTPKVSNNVNRVIAGPSTSSNKVNTSIVRQNKCKSSTDWQNTSTDSNIINPHLQRSSIPSRARSSSSSKSSSGADDSSFFMNTGPKIAGTKTKRAISSSSDSTSGNSTIAQPEISGYHLGSSPETQENTSLRPNPAKENTEESDSDSESWFAKPSKAAPRAKKKAKRNRLCADFFESQATRSGDEHSTDEDENDAHDFYEQSFVNDATQLTQKVSNDDMRAVYLRSVRSPQALTRVPLRYGVGHDIDVFSQTVRDEDLEDYEFDSFCMGPEFEESTFAEESVRVPPRRKRNAETPLKEGHSRGNKRQKRVHRISSSSDEEERLFTQKPR